MKEMVLDILDACANDVECFYFVFARVNYGGQVFPRSYGEGYFQYVDDHAWPIRVTGEDVIREIQRLISDGFLECWEESDTVRGELVPINALSVEQARVYFHYSAVTYEDHVAEFGSGPHLFKTTAKGLALLASGSEPPMQTPTQPGGSA